MVGPYYWCEVGSPGLVCKVGSPRLVCEVGSPGLVLISYLFCMSSVYMSVPISQFIPRHTLPSSTKQKQSYRHREQTYGNGPALGGLTLP